MRTAQVLTDLATNEIVNLRNQLANGGGGVDPNLVIRPDQLATLEQLFTQQTPPTGSVVAIDQNTLQITFSQAIDPGSAFLPGAVTIDNGPIAGINVAPDGLSMSVVTSNPMTQGQSYNVGLSLKTQSGQPLVANIVFAAGVDPVPGASTPTPSFRTMAAAAFRPTMVAPPAPQWKASPPTPLANPQWTNAAAYPQTQPVTVNSNPMAGTINVPANHPDARFNGLVR